MKPFIALQPVLAALLFTCFVTLAEPNTQKDSPGKFNPTPLNIVAVSNAKPYSFVLPDGTMTGLYVEFWNLWSEANNHPVSFSVANFADGIREVQNSNAIHIGLFRNAERKEWGDFSHPMFSIETGIIFSRNYANADYFHEGEKLSVGVLEESFQAGYIAEKYPFLNLHLYHDIDSTIPKLLNGELDAIVNDVPILLATLDKHQLNGVLKVANKKILTNDVHAVLAKGNPELLYLINSGIENIPIKSINELIKKWLPTRNTYVTEFQELTIEERNWLRALPELKFGLDVNGYPFGFLDEHSNQVKGIVVDYVNHVNETLSIELQPVYRDHWPELLDALKQGEIDILADIVNTPARRESLEFTVPYFVTDNVIVTLEHNFQYNSLGSLEGKTVGVVPGYEVELLERDYPDVNLAIVESVIDGIDKVRSEEIVAFVGPITVINYEIHKNQINNLRITAFLPYKLELSMSVRKGLEPLIPILNKVFNSMDEKQKVAINNKWMPVFVNTGLDVKTIIFWILPAALLILTVFLFLILKINRHLKKEVLIRQQAEKEAISANKAKSEFLSRMSHELRTPMNAILGFTQLLGLSENISPEDKESIMEVRKAGLHLLGLINEILDLAKIEAGKLSITLESVNLHTLLDECVNLLSPQAAKQAVKITIEVDKSVAVIADYTRLKQCILNLLSNAIKYNNKGGQVGISADISATDNLVKLAIKDNGPGISKDDQSKIFKPFERFGEEQYLTEGTGIGLAITKSLVTLMNGTISFESEQGTGSVFYITLPHARLKEVLPTDILTKIDVSHDYQPQDGRNVIVYIDDTPTNIKLMERILAKREDIALLSAHEPILGIELIKTCEPALILLDITMPTMDGYEVLKKLQSLFGNNLVPVIAVTANAMEKDPEKGIAAGFAEYITKPINVSEFYNAIDRHLDIAPPDNTFVKARN